MLGSLTPCLVAARSPGWFVGDPASLARDNMHVYFTLSSNRFHNFISIYQIKTQKMILPECWCTSCERLFGSFSATDINQDIHNKKNAYALKTPHVVFQPVICLSLFFGRLIDKLQGSQGSMGRPIVIF